MLRKDRDIEHRNDRLVHYPIVDADNLSAV